MNLIDQVMRESLVFRSRSLADHENIQKSIEKHAGKAFKAHDDELLNQDDPHIGADSTELELCSLIQSHSNDFVLKINLNQ